MSIGQRVKQLRGKLTLKEFAEPLGVSGAAISNIESDRSEPSNDLSIKICEIYGCTMDWLIRGVETNTFKEPQENYVTISKDELLDLYKKLNQQQEQQISKLQEQVQSTKNIEGVSN